MLGLLVLVSLGVCPHPQDPPTHLGTWTHTIHDLATPTSVAIGPGQRIHVVETSAHQVRVFDRAGKPLGRLALPADPLLFPLGVAVAPDGKRFVSDSGNHRIVVFDEQGAFSHAFGSHGTEPGQFHTPAGIDANGTHVIVADRVNRRVQIFDHAGSLVRLLPLPDADAGSWPSDVLLTPDGQALVLDGGGCRVLAFDGEGDLLCTLGEFGFFPGTFASPRGLGLDRNNLLVADFENHRIQVFPLSALAHSTDSGQPSVRPTYILGVHAIRPREGRGKLHYPQDVAAAPDGSFAVLAEPWDGRVQIFDRAPGREPAPDPQRAATGQASAHYGMQLASDGPLLALVEPETAEILIHDLRAPIPGQSSPPILISRAGGRGRRLGLYRSPTGLFMDYPSRTLLVCDRDNRRLHALTFQHDLGQEIHQDFEMVSGVRMLDFQLPGATGSEALPWTVEPIAVTVREDGTLFVLDVANERVLEFDGDWTHRRSLGGHGSGAGQLRAPVDLALSPDGQSLYVTDSGNRRVVRWSLGDGSASHLGEGRLLKPHGVVVGADGRVYISDAAAHRILVFDGEGQEVGAFGTRGLVRGSFDSPRGLAFNGSGQLIVLDHANHRGIVLTSDGEYVDAFGPRGYTRPARHPESFKEEDYRE